MLCDVDGQLIESRTQEALIPRRQVLIPTDQQRAAGETEQCKRMPDIVQMRCEIALLRR